MSVPEIDVFDADPETDIGPYRTISKAAVLSPILGILSLGGLLFPTLLTLALAGFLLGIYASRQIRRYPDEYAGRLSAMVGLVVSMLAFVAGVVAHSVAYATEVPSGYVRTSFDDLQPSPENSELPISAQAAALNGKRVFVKGYVYPDGQQSAIKHFVLVRDLGTCCFGGQPKLTHMIEVTLEDPLRIEYAIRKRGLGGILKVDTQLKPVSGLGGVYFQLSADYLR